MESTDRKMRELSHLHNDVTVDGGRADNHPVHVLARFLRSVLGAADKAATRRLLTCYGVRWGESDAEMVGGLVDWSSTEEWIAASMQVLSQQGFARAEASRIEWSEERGSFFAELRWEDFGELNAELSDDGCPASWIFAGYMSGYTSYCSGRRIYFVETDCTGIKGASESGCLCLRGKDEDSWGDEIRSQLQFFDSDGLDELVERMYRNDASGDPAQAPASRSTRVRASSGFINVDSKPVEVQSESFLHVLEISNRVAAFDLPILITGETGTGKEVLARHVHENSQRKDGPFIGINCAALQETLLASELFGYRAGAFTGATKDRQGLFEEANGGTIFLDEIGDVPPTTQVALLCVLQEQEVTRLGENRPRKIDARIMAATNRDLGKAIDEGTFREDLYYRLGVVAIELPPLRDRREDIIPLARYFLKSISERMKTREQELDGACLDYLLNHDWPGNVRELRNTLERAVVMNDDGIIRPEDLMPGVIQAKSSSRSQSVANVARTLEDVEMEHIRAVLAATDGNRARAARMLNISPATLWRKLKQIEE